MGWNPRPAIRRDGQSFLWSRGEEMILERFPELIEPISQLPDGTVLDGEILGWRDGQVLPFSDLQRRIGRKTVGRKLLTEVPVRFVAFDTSGSRQGGTFAMNRMRAAAPTWKTFSRVAMKITL